MQQQQQQLLEQQQQQQKMLLQQQQQQKLLEQQQLQAQQQLPVKEIFISSPEHEVLMVSYCGQWLSVVRRRASCDVRRPSCVVRQHLMFTL